MEKALDIIINRGGLLGALFVIALGVAVFFYREMRKAEEDHDTKLTAERALREAMYADRLAEARAITQALQQSSAANVLLEKASDERVAAIRDLTAGFAQLVTKTDAREERCSQIMANYERRLESIDRNTAEARREAELAKNAIIGLGVAR